MGGHILHQSGSAARAPPSARQASSSPCSPPLSSCSPGLLSDLPWCPVASREPESWPPHQPLLRGILSTSLPDRGQLRGDPWKHSFSLLNGSMPSTPRLV